MVPLTDVLRPTIATGGKLTLPVANFSAWANFKYVEGVPAGQEGGFSISRLQVLDTIIDSLVSLRDKQALRDLPKDHSNLSDGQMDALIRDLAKRLQASASATPAGLPSSIGSSFGLAVSQTGAAVNILV
jgi:hypothetical protein